MPDVRSHLDQLADRGEHRGAVEVFRRARADLPETRPLVPRSPRWQLVSAVVAVLVAAGAVVVLRAGESGDRVQVTGPGPDLAAGWTPLVKASAGIGDWTVRSVAATKSGFVAVGERPTTSSNPVGMWTSPNGRQWTALTPDELPTGAVSLAAVAAQPDGTSWIVGTDASGPAVWRSNGRSWTRSASGPGVLKQAKYFSGVTATASDLLVFGDTTDGRQGTWTSTDGKAWRFTPLPGEILSVADTDDRLIALIDVRGDDSYAAVVFTSTDHAATWTRGTELGSTADQPHAPLTCNDAGCWAATGPVAGAGPMILWRSGDGLRWNNVGPTITTGGTIDTLTAIDGYVVATGVGDQRPLGWVSNDGLRWTAMARTARVNPVGGGRLDVVGASNKRLVAFGSTPGLEYFFTWDVP